jgi:Flp pilus assembly protein TadG
MPVKTDAAKRSGFLARLRADESGNAIAIMAAAVVPVIGLVGGGVDMSRLYLAQTRLQAACDAGALMGRKVMGPGSWSDNSFKARTEAQRAFDANFAPGGFGTGTVTKSFTEASGKVTGSASVEVPMTLMKVFGQGERVLDVQCSAEMRIPNSDVMFVLDTTGSMDGAANGQAVTGSNLAKITELKRATKCFYEILTQRNIDDVTPAQCGESADPVDSASNTSQIRFGFVNYSSNVNVGRLLPLNFMADAWQYQTRRANWVTDPDYSYTLGNPGAMTQNGSPSVTGGNWSSWSNVSNDVTVNGTLYPRRVERTFNFSCSTISWPPSPQPNGSTTNGPNQVGGTPTPVYPATSVTINYQTVTSDGQIEYRYNQQNNRRCDLQRRTRTTTTTTNYTAQRPVTWIPREVFQNWTYNQYTVNIAALKDTANNSYNNSITLPIGSSGANTTIAWDGCILERQTDRTMTVWDTSDTSTAKDMAINLVPNASDPTTLWGPRLAGLLYHRTDGSNNRTLNPITTTSNFSRPSTPECPTQSKIYQVWDPTDYKNYINSITTGGNTYHDIGMLWGARLMSPVGIFADHNAVLNDNVQRHMIFMTDGDTNTTVDTLSAYNFPWYDRLQTSASSPPTNTQLDNLTDSRLLAICEAVKNMNIQLWVVSYGNGVSSTTEDRLENCASPNKYFPYVPGQSLTAQFKQIAGQIAALRLTT